MFYVYALRVSGTHDFRYVGLTTRTPEERLRSHLKDSRRNDNRAILKWLRKHSHTVRVHVLEETPEDFDYLCFRESFWIAALREQGYSLLNHTDGGEGRLGKTGPRIDRVGEKFGNLTVLALESTGPARWLCLCTCGNTCTPRSYNLTSGNSKSCGKCTVGDVCSVSDCGKSRYGAGTGHQSTLCVTHHMRRFRYGNLEGPKSKVL